MTNLTMGVVHGTVGIIYGAIAITGAATSHLLLLFLWPAIAFLLVSVSYFFSQGLGVSLLGKRYGPYEGTAGDGTLPWLNFLCLWPWFAQVWLVWLARITCGDTRAERPWDCVNPAEAAAGSAPRIYVGRYPRFLGAAGFPEGVANVVDLTAEMPSPAWVRKGTSATRTSGSTCSSTTPARPSGARRATTAPC